MLQALRLQAALDLAGHQDFLEALGRRHGVHALDEAVHAGSEVVGADEESGPEREEEMAGVLRPLEVEELVGDVAGVGRAGEHRSEEHTSDLQSLMRISYAVFCLK